MLPLLSIIIPAYKRAKQVRKTLELIYKSNGWKKRYIPEDIISDASPDDSVKKIIPKFVNPAPIYHRPDKPGIAASKNSAMKRTNFEIIIICDSDMEVEFDTLINTLTYLKGHPTAAMVSGQIIWKGGQKSGELDRPRKEDRIKTVDGTDYIEAIYSRFFATYKSLFWQARGYDEEIFNMRGEGSDLSIKYWRSGFPLAYTDRIRVHHVHEAE